MHNMIYCNIPWMQLHCVKYYNIIYNFMAHNYHILNNYVAQCDIMFNNLICHKQNKMKRYSIIQYDITWCDILMI